jgi:hypothetical protein
MKSPGEWFVGNMQAQLRKLGLSGGRALNESELAKLKAQAENDIRRAAGQNKGLADVKVQEMKKEADKVNSDFKKEEKERSLLPSLVETRTGIKSVLIAGTVVLVAAIVIQVVSLFRPR